MLYQTLDARHFFTGWRLFDSACRIRIYEALHASEELPTVILASQIAGCAASVTNYAEDLVTEVVRMHRARRCLEAGDPRYEFVWIEHFPAGILSIEPDECFRFVTFQQMPDGSLASPTWGEEISKDDVEASVIGCSLGD